MTTLEDIRVSMISLLSSSACDILIDSISANFAQNLSLKEIELIDTGGAKNQNFSEAAKATVATLEAKGVVVK